MVAIRRTIGGRNSCPLGHARREPFRNSKEQTDCCLLYLTERRCQRQFGAKTSAPWIPECLGASGRARCLAECGSGKKILLVDFSNCPAHEVEKIARAAPDYITVQPRGSVLVLTDLTGAAF